MRCDCVLDPAPAFFYQARVLVAVAGREAIGQVNDATTGEIETGVDGAPAGGG